MGTPHAPMPLAWDRSVTLTYLANTVGAVVLSVISVAFFQDRWHDADEVIPGIGFLVAIAWFISFVVAGAPLHRPEPEPDMPETAADEDLNTGFDDLELAGLTEFELEPSR